MTFVWDFEKLFARNPELCGAARVRMYALSTMVGYDASALELVSCEAGVIGDAYVRDASIVYNALSPVFAGYAMESGATLTTMTFKVIAEGSTDITVSRANVSNYTGMRSMPCVASGISVATGAAVTPIESPEGTTAGTATDEDKTLDSLAAFADTVRSNPDTARNDDGQLTQSAYETLMRAGVTESELAELGFSQDEIAAAKDGAVAESSSVSSASSSASGTQAGDAVSADQKAQAQSQVPIVPIVVVVIVVVVAAVAFFAVRKKRA